MDKIPFIGVVFAFINKQLDGSKTVIGIVGAVATFIVLVCNQLADGLQSSDIELIMAGFSAMMLAIGLGHKAKKIEDAVKK